MNNAALRELGINPWERIADEFSDSDLLLGNGFSMKLSHQFSYTSLFSRFMEDCRDRAREVFSSFNTTNFELILEQLTSAVKVGDLFDIDCRRIDRAIQRLRNGLVKAIQENHPRSEEIDWGRLRNLSLELDAFGNIYTVNYDALLYHIIMISRDRYDAGVGVKRYNDFYWKHYDDRFLAFVDYQDYPDYQYVYYLHGALFLFKHDYIDVKIRSTDFELIDEIASEIQGGNFPLFVSEGESSDKQRAITRSDYLHFANSALREKREQMVLYGISLADQDQHIIDALRRSTKQLAISVFTLGRDENYLESELNRFRSKLPGKDIAFFDSRTLFHV